MGLLKLHYLLNFSKYPGPWLKCLEKIFCTQIEEVYKSSLLTLLSESCYNRQRLSWTTYFCKQIYLKKKRFSHLSLVLVFLNKNIQSFRYEYKITGMGITCMKIIDLKRKNTQKKEEEKKEKYAERILGLCQ